MSLCNMSFILFFYLNLILFYILRINKNKIYITLLLLISQMKQKLLSSLSIEFLFYLDSLFKIIIKIITL